MPDNFRPLIRKHHPEGHPFRETSFWNLSVLFSNENLRLCYFKTPAGEEVPWHHDDIVWTTFNYLVEGDSPFVYKTGEVFYYKCGLFDVSKEHMVPASDKERVLLKFSLIKQKYEDVKPRLDTSLKGRQTIDYKELIEIFK